MNKTILCGRLGADPDLRGSVLKLRLATTERRKDQSGNWSDHTEWHAIVVFGRRAEALNRLLRKGSRVLVEGKLRTSSWEKDGEKRYKTEVAADEVELLDGRQEREAPRRLPTPDEVTRAGHALDLDGDDMPF